ncbi:MAG: AarF/ABC1/UbiB kinase family protein [Deltaproteobacteria bacterium]|nr:MAG: AarF/ABC1/UbiB kinase family protein [Deltaproteobacteria bacterium]
MRAILLVIRGVWISLVLLWAFAVYGVRRAVRWRLKPEEKEKLRGEVMARAFERLGATFIKFGQILSTRPDLLGPGYIEPLSRLQDQVAPARWRAVSAMLDAELGPERRARFVEIAPEPIAAASVAQVHRAVLDTGEVVALKVQRPGVHRLIHGDLSILGFWARVVALIPSMKPLSLPGAVERFGVSLAGQLDFRLEAANNRRFAAMFADWEGLDVPKLVEELCTERVLSMEFVDGVKGSEPDAVGGDRARLARLGADAILHMVFTVGFVHADLHPGNIILTEDGRVVFIDLGMVAEIPRDLMRPWTTTFLALGQQNAAEVARLLYIYSPKVAKVDYCAYEQALVDHFARFHGKALGEVEIAEVVGGVMNILRRYRITIDSSFTVVNIALLVAEGLGKQLDPTLDVVQRAVPVLFKAAAAAGTGIPPRREVPCRDGDRPPPEPPVERERAS